ncbi:MAG: hypothetical protein WC508_00575 [Patescibacteria group bacterium]
MFKIIKKAKTNIILSICAIVCIVYLSGHLGLGQFLRNHLAFGYGGGGGAVILPEIVAINKPLYIPTEFRGGRQFRQLDGVSVTLEVPPLVTSGYTMFDTEITSVNSSNRPCVEGNFVLADKVFTIIANDVDGHEVTSFPRGLTVSLTLANLPADTSNVGIYYLNNNSQWVLGQKAIFDNVNNRTSFQIKDLGVIALINAPGLPRVIEAGSQCSVRPQVLGIKQYSEGTPLRTCDGETYIVSGTKIIKQVKKPPLTAKTFEGKTIYDVDFSVIVELSGQRYDGKNYKNGDLLRTCDWKIYRVENQKLRHIGTWQELHEKYEGQKINNVDYWVIADYQQLPVLSPSQQVLGVKQYADGSLIRTSDGRIYIIENQSARYISSLDELKKYANQKIYNVTSDVVIQYNQPNVEYNSNKVLGVKFYADGTYLRTRDWKVYVVENQKARQVATMIAGSQDYYLGQKIYDVDYGVIAQYTTQQSSVATQQVLGAKSYANGTLLRTADGKVYIVDNQKIRPADQADLQNRGNSKLYDVNYDTITNYGGQSVLGVKLYADGTYLKTPDWRLYVIENQKARYIDTIAASQISYNGQPVYNVDYGVLTQY